MRKPDFISVGVNKAGTTYLYRLLLQNNKFFKAKEKEIDFFHGEDVYDINKYLSYFQKAKNDQIAYDLTTTYYFKGKVFQQITKEFPDTKIVIFLRNPVKKAISNYHFNNFLYNTKYSLEDNIQTYKDKPSCDFNTYEHPHIKIIESSFYFKIFEKWISFYKENLKVIIFEELIKNPQEVMDDLHDFLNIERFEYSPSVDKMETVKIRNEFIRISMSLFDKSIKFIFSNQKTRNKFLRISKYIKRKTGVKAADPISEESLSYLKSIYKDDVANLSKLINKDLTKLWGFDKE
jgi:hypothetical protein